MRHLGKRGAAQHETTASGVARPGCPPSDLLATRGSDSTCLTVTVSAQMQQPGPSSSTRRPGAVSNSRRGTGRTSFGQPAWPSSWRLPTGGCYQQPPATRGTTLQPGGYLQRPAIKGLGQFNWHPRGRKPAEPHSGRRWERCAKGWPPSVANMWAIAGHPHPNRKTPGAAAARPRRDPPGPARALHSTARPPSGCRRTRCTTQGRRSDRLPRPAADRCRERVRNRS